MTGDILTLLVGLGVTIIGGQIGLWLRFEHRMTILEERLRLRELLEDQRHNRANRPSEPGAAW